MGSTSSKIACGAGLILGGVFFMLFQEDSDGSFVSGIENMGNTCFLNSILQALSSCDTITQFLFKLKPVQKSAEDHDALIVNELTKFLQALIQGKKTSPEDLILALSYKFPYFGQQHDSHEIFYVIHESIAIIKKRTENSLSFEVPISNPLLGLMSTEIFCSTCHTKSIKLDCIFDISVNVTESLYDSFDNLYKPQMVEDFLCIKCSTEASLSIIKNNAATPLIQQMIRRYSNRTYNLEESDLLRKVKTKAIIRNKIVKFPDVLCIHCKWLVSHSSGFIHKKKQHMRFPAVLKVEKGTYELKAVVEHIGGSMGGHYITYKIYLNSWYRCSDTSVKEVTESDVMSAQPYMIFYQLSI
jgi:ubiquitin C-terminal hydrolase